MFETSILKFVTWHLEKSNIDKDSFINRIIRHVDTLIPTLTKRGYIFNSLRPSDAYICRQTDHHWLR